MTVQAKKDTSNRMRNRIILGLLICSLGIFAYSRERIRASFANQSAALACSADYLIDETLPNGSRWEMCWEHRAREGIVYYDITYTTSEGDRNKVLAQASIAQVHVPYDDNGARYHDISDYGFGNNYLNDMQPNDCPGGTLIPYGSKDVLCQQIENRGYVYKDEDGLRQGHALSVFSVSHVGAYNYIPQWRFYDDGTIEPIIGATGRLQRRGSNSLYGWPIRTDNTTGISHTHNFYWRLDFDLGGNSADDLIKELNFNADATNERRELEVTTFTTETRRSVNPDTQRSWLIVDGATNADGHNLSYQIDPLNAGHREVGPSYEKWTFEDFYATQNRSCEIYASHNPGTAVCKDNVYDFVDGQTLTDSVIWFGQTFHHVPRDEDEPYMHAHWSGFQITPRDWTATNELVNTTPPVNDPPVADIAADVTTGPAPLAVAFDASGSTDSDGTVVRYDWNFGDGNGQADGAATQTHTYSADGTYNASVTVTDDDGDSHSASVSIVVNNVANVPPTVSLSSSVPGGFAPLEVTFDGSGSADSDGTIVRYDWDFGDGSTAEDGGDTVTHTYTSAGTFTVALAVTDDDGAGALTTMTIEVINIPEPTGCSTGLLHEWWTGIPGLTVADLTSNENYPNNPTDSAIITTFETPTNILDSYGVRVRGYIVPSVSGDYTFWIASDDNGELWLSTDDSAANAQRIATMPSWSPSRDFDRYPEQQSASITLVANQKYYVEALMKEWGGGDNLAVAWQTPTAARAVIGMQYLCQLQFVGSAPTAAASADTTTGTAPLSVNFDGTASTDADGPIASYDWVFGDGSTASGATVSHTFTSSGLFSVELTVTDSDGRTDTASVDISVSGDYCAQNGLLHEWWNGIAGLTIEDLTSNANYPSNPTGSGLISDFETPTNISDSYGVRVRGYVIAPVSGDYTFWIASDDNGSLLLSTTDSPNDAVEIASVPSWTPSRQWDWFAEQQSDPVTLVAGEQYYIEALMKEWGGGDNLAVAWQMPGGARQVIPAPVLCPGESNGAPPTAEMSAAPTLGEAPLTVSFDGAASSDPDGPLVSYAWAFGNGDSSNAATPGDIVYTEPGTYVATLTVTDGDGLTDSTMQTILVTGPGGEISCDSNGVVREVWTNIWSGGVTGLQGDPRYPHSPDSTTTLTTLRSPTNEGDGYGSRMRAYVIAPETGLYTFWVASDNEGQLWISTDANPGNATLQAQTFWSPELGWDFSAAQQSDEMLLVEGQAYYIEGLHFASWGSDYFGVAWDTPSGERELIPTAQLCPVDTGGGGGRDVTDTLAINDLPFVLTPIGRTLSTSAMSQGFWLLASDQQLRAESRAVEAEFERLRANDLPITAEFISDLTDLYYMYLESADSDLETWLLNLWRTVNIEQFEGESAADAWERINVATVPTAVGLRSAEAGAMSSSTIIVLSVVLMLFTVLTLKRRRVQ